MKRAAHWALLSTVLMAAAVWTPALADDVSDADRLICAPMFVNECRADMECITGPPHVQMNRVALDSERFWSSVSRQSTSTW